MPTRLNSFAVLMPAVKHPTVLGGGHQQSLRLAELLGHHVPTRIITYTERQDGAAFLDDVLPHLRTENTAAILTWGPDVNRLLRRLHGRLPLLYYQQSYDWGITLPPDVPVVVTSKVMYGKGQLHWPANPIFYLPAALDRSCRNTGIYRDIDILVINRKQPTYIRHTLIPQLQKEFCVHVQDGFIPKQDLYCLFNRAKIYLYAYAPQRTPYDRSGWRMFEGYGLQVMEAAACGCTVGTDNRGGYTHFLEPGIHGFQLQTHSLEWDLHQVAQAVRTFPQTGQERLETFLQDHYGEDAFHARAVRMIEFLTEYYAFAATHRPDPEVFGLPTPISLGQRVHEAAYRFRRRCFPSWH